MGKSKNNAGNANADGAASEKVQKSAGTINFLSTEETLDSAQQQVRLPHISKPFARESWERARPWMLMQRQKLEGMGWAPADNARIDLYSLKRNAPHGSFTDDGLVYLRVPKAFINFHRSGKPEDDKKDDKAHRHTRRNMHSTVYGISDPLVWKLKIDAAESEEADRVPNVVFDVVEPMENIAYLVMTLAPGLIVLNASRKDAMIPGSHVVETSPGAPSIRHQGLFASSEELTRTLAPAFWYKRNAEHLRKILGDAAFEATLRAAEDEERCTTRKLGQVAERVWEEVLPVQEKKKKTSKKTSGKRRDSTATNATAAEAGNNAPSANFTPMQAPGVV